MFRALACVVALSVMSWARAVSGQAPAAGTGVIAGRVTDQATGHPLGNVRVRATSPASSEGRSAYTDARGRYKMAELPDGPYFVTVTKAAYLFAAYGAPRPLEPGLSIDVLSKRPLLDIDFRLLRGGAIVGTVSD